MFFKKYYLVFVLIYGTASAQYITTDETRTPTQLIEDVLMGGAGGCASVSNVSVSGGVFTSNEKSWGYFNSNGSVFPFTEGIILSTGRILDARGPNDFVSDDGNGMGWGGDLDLNTALGISNSINATVLEFDFVPLGNRISFDYIFSSEEYHGNATCTYSDGFAFLLKEVGGSTYQNLALIPNTNIPVKVTSVHPDIPGACTAQNEQYFDAFNPTEHPTNFNGQTTVLTAQSAVIPGQPYHIKLVIADEGNYRYDSAIFLKAGSFSFGQNLGGDRSFANGNPVCFDETITLDGTITGALSYQWYFGNNPIPGETNGTLTLSPPYTSSQNGYYNLATLVSPLCATYVPVYLDFAPQLITGQTVYDYCDNDANQDGIMTLTLSDVIPTLFPNLPVGIQVNFYNSPTSNLPLADSHLMTTPFQQIIYAKAGNNNCYPMVAVTFNVKTFTDTIADENIGICNNVPATLTADSGYVSYVWSTGETSQSIQVSSAGTYTVTIGNADGCTKIKTFTVANSQTPTITGVNVIDLNNENTAEIITDLGGNYEYSVDGVHFQSSPIFNNLTGLIYTAYVRDLYQCGVVSLEFHMMQIPSFFTPNGDGYNDLWNIKGIDPTSANSNSIISIFDRFGKLIKQISPNGTGWNGIYNGKIMPGDDYWYTIELRDGRTGRGHFTLKR